MTAHAVDPGTLAGGWVNCDTTATGIHVVDAAIDRSGLTLRITERGGPEPPQGALASTTTPVTRAILPAVPLADDIDATEAVAFLAEGPLDSRQVVLVGYLNRGLLTIDVHTVHTVHPAGTRIPNTMYRAHFFRFEEATPI